MEPVVEIGYEFEDEGRAFAQEAFEQHFLKPRANLFRCGVFGFAGGKSVPKSDRFKAILRAKMLGRTFSEDTLQKMRISQREARRTGRLTSVPPNNRGRSYKMRLVACPHCGTSGKGGNMTRYHFDKCKKKDGQGTSVPC